MDLRKDFKKLCDDIPVDDSKKAKRMEWFKKFDPNGNKILSLAELDKGVRDVLKINGVFASKKVIFRAQKDTLDFKARRMNREKLKNLVRRNSEEQVVREKLREKLQEHFAKNKRIEEKKKEKEINKFNTEADLIEWANNFGSANKVNPPKNKPRSKSPNKAKPKKDAIEEKKEAGSPEEGTEEKGNPLQSAFNKLKSKKKKPLSTVIPKKKFICSTQFFTDKTIPPHTSVFNYPLWTVKADLYINVKDFKRFLMQLRQQMELQILFLEIDEDQDGRISLEEFETAKGLFAAWGLSVKNPVNTFSTTLRKEMDGYVLFEEFVDWVIITADPKYDPDCEDELMSLE